MKKEELIKCIKLQNLSYSSKLEEFFDNFSGVVEELCAHALPEERFLVNELCSWLELEGYEDVCDTVLDLSESDKDRVIGFLEYYRFMFAMARSNQEQMVDLLFFVPGQFAREFYNTERQNKNQISWCIEQQVVTSYDYISAQGTLSKVSCFI